jgi:hypothetical protein
MSEKLRSTLEIAETKYQAPDTEPSVPSAPERIIAIPAQRASPESLSTSDATTDSAATPELTPLVDTETSTSSETLHTDVEILGNHYPVRQMIREIGNQRMRVAESFTVRMKNIFVNAPKKVHLGLARSIAQGRLERKQAKFDAVSRLSDRNVLKRRRLKKLQEAQAKFTSADHKYQTHTSSMQKRVEDIGQNVEIRRAAYRKELRARRESALGRRALRHELRAQDAGRFEARAVLKDIPKEHLERVGKLAATAYASERKAAQADKQKKATISHETRTLEAISDNRRRMGEAANEAKKADGIVEKLKTETIPKAKEHLESLQAQLDDYEDDDPARTSLQIQIQETEDRIAIYEQREVPYWSQVALSNRQRVLTLDENHSTLTANLTQNTTAKKAAVTNATSARATADTHKAELLKAAAEATDSAPESNN